MFVCLWLNLAVKVKLLILTQFAYSNIKSRDNNKKAGEDDVRNRKRKKKYQN